MKTKGFTVIELIVIIIIIGILMVLAIPAFRGTFMRARLEGARNDVFAFYQRVNRYATTEGVNYTLEVNGTNESLRCMREGVTTKVRDSVVLRSELDLQGATITFTVQSDGFVRAAVREFKIYDNDTQDSLTFYISPLGVMEVN